MEFIPFCRLSLRESCGAVPATGGRIRGRVEYNVIVSLPELLTRWTIRLALAGYFIGAGLEVTARPPDAHRLSRQSKLARAFWTIGCVLYLAHVACAFGFFHGWSHAAAYLHTAERTQTVFGWHWGGGLYFNYAFTGIWLLDALWWWRSPLSRRSRPRWLSTAIHGFLWFMVANATIVFETGPTYWFGVVGCASLIVLWACYGGRAGAA